MGVAGQRMFVAVVPPRDVREHLEEFLEPRSGMPWIHPEQWHVTLAFLASVDDHRVDELVERLAATAAKRDPFGAVIEDAGAFPNPAKAAVLYLAVNPVRPPPSRHANPLHRLAVNARAAANSVGAPPDGKAFTAHVTLARLRPPRDVTPWIRVLDTYRSPTWLVDHIELVASHLGEGPNRRPRYETVAALPLRAAQ